MTSRKSVVTAWVDAFNPADVDTIATLYTEDATNQQVANAPSAGSGHQRRDFRSDSWSEGDPPHSDSSLPGSSEGIEWPCFEGSFFWRAQGRL